jgi:hypothetical protein
VRHSTHAAARQREAVQLVGLLSDTEPIDNGPIPRIVDAAEIIQQPPPPPYQLEQSPPGMVVFLVRLKMFGEIRDAIGQDRNLDFRRSGVRIMPPILCDQFCFGFFE